MNLEKYRNEMSHKVPDRALVEVTLSQAKRQLEKPKSEFWKNVGVAGLSAAVLVGAFFGAGAVRSLFKDINTDYEKAEEENTVIAEEITESEDRITATDNELSVTPLSNPKYTVKATTPDGKVSLDENTTVAEMLACGVPVNTENGILGIQYFCEALKKYKENIPFEFILGDVTQDAGTRYDYYNYTAEDKNYDEYGNAQSDTTYWKYQHRGYLSVNKYVGSQQQFANWVSETNGEIAGILLCGNGYQLGDYGIVTIFDTLGLNAESREEQKEVFYNKMTTFTELDNDKRQPLLSVIYNGKCKGKFRMNNFIEKVENGVEYASVQYTDITTTDEYEERLYSIEYCQGVYSIFTMTDGLDGKFDTQYFDGYTVTDGMVVFDNGNVRYVFALSETPDADASMYNEDALVYDNLSAGFYTDYSLYGTNLNIAYDRAYVEDMFSEKLMDCLVINEEYSTGDLNAVKLSAYSFDHNYGRAILYLDPVASHLFTAQNGDVYILSEIAFETYENGLLVDEHDGEQYLMITDKYLELLREGKWFGLHMGFNNDDGVNKWLIEENVYVPSTYFVN